MPIEFEKSKYKFDAKICADFKYFFKKITQNIIKN